MQSVLSIVNGFDQPERLLIDVIFLFHSVSLSFRPSKPQTVEVRMSFYGISSLKGFNNDMLEIESFLIPALRFRFNRCWLKLTRSWRSSVRSAMRTISSSHGICFKRAV